MKMVTASGRLMDLADPSAEAITIFDIAKSLSRICRFNGHTTRRYSVAQHSLACARFGQERGWSAVRQFNLLMHDAHEVYLGDLTTPLVSAMDRLSHDSVGVVVRSMKVQVDRAIAAALGVPCGWVGSLEVSQVDEFMLHVEG